MKKAYCTPIIKKVEIKVEEAVSTCVIDSDGEVVARNVTLDDDDDDDWSAGPLGVNWWFRTWHTGLLGPYYIWHWSPHLIENSTNAS